jgi:DNA-binding response OmpR family regulator
MSSTPATSTPWILIVDDDREMRDYMHQCLASLPYRIEEAENGSEALPRRAMPVLRKPFNARQLRRVVQFLLSNTQRPM